MLLRDRLIARMAEMGDHPDHQRLVAEVLGIRNAPAELARRLVAQALVLEDRRAEWVRIGERICAKAPAAPGVYLLRDANDAVLYVGKANNIRRRLRTHFAARRWRVLKPEFARAVSAEWLEVGSELEALLREAEWIETLRPAVNVQVGGPALGSRQIPAALIRDVVVILRSIEDDSAELVAARASGPTLMQRTRRNGADLAVHAQRLWRFFRDTSREGGEERGLAPIVFSWLAERGAAATRLDPGDAATSRHLGESLRVALTDDQLFSERIVVLNSVFRLSLRAPARRASGATPSPRP
jgi:predicted GIY-YIG superfamily endonuclease